MATASGRQHDEVVLRALFIDGRWTEGAADSGPRVFNPSDGSMLGLVPMASTAQIDESLAAAQRGFSVWRETAPEQRAALLLKVAALMRERQESIARLITLEQGKTIADARQEVSRATVILEWDAGEAVRLYGRIVPSAPGMRNMVLVQPIGPVAAFTPWNAPVGSLARKVSGALAAGCSMIVKAPEETPASACAFVKCFEDAGLPGGVLNLLFGHPSEISARLIASPVIRLVTFTGSVGVGRQLAQLAGQHMKPAVMELGGHAPVIVCADADAQRLGRVAAMAKFRMSGQICVSPTRFIVHRSLMDSFVAALSSATAALKVGDGFEPGMQVGPLANARRVAHTQDLVDDAVAAGASLVTGGNRIGDRGFFFAPTVLSEVPIGARVMSTEPFGPIAAVSAFDDLREAIALANSLPLGLSAYAFTNAADAAAQLADRLECGILSINHFGGPAPNLPFGGVKDSGMGREGGAESLQSFTVRKTVSHSTLPY